MNCTHEWSSGIYGLAYRCKKCDCLPPLDVAHHVALERIKDTFKQLTSARSRIEELEEALQKLPELFKLLIEDSKMNLAAGGGCDHEVGVCACGVIRMIDESEQALKQLEDIARQALSGKPVEPKEVGREELADVLSEVEFLDELTNRGYNEVADHLLSHFDIRRKG